MPTRQIPLQEFSQIDSDRLIQTLRQHPNRDTPSFADNLRDQEPDLNANVPINQGSLNVWYTMADYNIAYIQRVLNDRAQDVGFQEPSQMMEQQQMLDYMDFMANYQELLVRDQQLQQQEPLERDQQLGRDQQLEREQQEPLGRDQQLERDQQLQQEQQELLGQLQQERLERFQQLQQEQLQQEQLQQLEHLQQQELRRRLIQARQRSKVLKPKPKPRRGM